MILLFVRLKFHEFCGMKFSGRTCLPVYPPQEGSPAEGLTAFGSHGRQAMPPEAGTRVDTPPPEAVLIKNK
jgi:hypothetical protein